MENPSQKCEICAEAGPNQTINIILLKAETHLELSDEDLCEKFCLNNL